jgi:LmbE family N-acetylglucosaminyl deacetylase
MSASGGASPDGHGTGRPRVVVVSPHFDDVPLSLGESLRSGVLSRCRVEVRVAFARTDWTRWVHPSPARAPFVGALRRSEEFLASRCFGYRFRTGRWAEVVLRTGVLDPASFLDPGLDLSGEPLVEEIGAWLDHLCSGADSTRPALLLVPAGLGGHLDHRIVAAAAVGRRMPVPVGFYEDRPYASYLDDGARARQLAAVTAGLQRVEFSPPVRRATQRLARICYPSQIDHYFVDAMDRDLRDGVRESVWFPPGECPGWV